MKKDTHFLDAVPKTKSGSADTSAVSITFNADADERWALLSIDAQFSVAPLQPRLLIASINSVAVWTMSINDGLEHEFLFPRGIWTLEKNHSIHVALGGSLIPGVIAYLNFSYA